MKQSNILIALLFTAAVSLGQGLVKIGDKVPNYHFTKVVNAPNPQLDIARLKGKPAILVFWGTWCAPCIPEMIDLAKLQKQFGSSVQIIGVSIDDEQKLKAFLAKRPSKIWYASDPSNNLWNIFDLQTAGHAVLIDKNNMVSAITETKKIDSSVLKTLIASNQLNLHEERGTRRLVENEDPVKSDSNTLYSFIVQPELKGITPMMKRPQKGPFANRRITIINLSPAVVLRIAYDISVPQNVIYPTKSDSLKSTQNSFCIDLIVPDNDKANLNAHFKNEINQHLPVKGEIQKRLISCYILRPAEDKPILLTQSAKSGNEYSFNGLEFSGEGVLMKSFVSYLENELRYPVYDATGLTKFYDIDFKKNNTEPVASIKESLAKLGLELVQGEKEMGVLVITSR